jgi:hypothetical protein
MLGEGYGWGEVKPEIFRQLVTFGTFVDICGHLGHLGTFGDICDSCDSCDSSDSCD